MTKRRVVITGVNRGIGRELAQRFIDDGHRVWGTSRDGTAPEGVHASVYLDLRDESSVVGAASEIGSATESLDLLINCAGADGRSFGAAPERRGPFDYDAAAFTSVLETNTTGPMLVTRYLLPLLRAGSAPMIVNVSSQLGSMQLAPLIGEDAAYCVSKAALNMLSIKAAAVLRDEGIGVVMLHPGWVVTDMGGPGADLPLSEAATAVASTIESLTIADSGRFVRWDGQDLPW